jgi:hypothetical protein
MTRLKVEESWVERFIKPWISILPVFVVYRLGLTSTTLCI